MHLLIVDDEKPILESFRSILQPTGYKFDLMSDPVKALGALKNVPYDAIITDYKMPEINGIEFLKRVKAIDPDIFIILITAFGNLQISMDAINNGVFAFFEKPLNIGLLINKLKEIEKRLLKRKQFYSEVKTLERELRKSQKFESIAVFASGIAHDFNNILAPIYGYAELAMLNLKDNHELSDYMKEIVVAAKRAKELIQQIQRFNRAQEKQNRVFAIAPIIKETVKLLKAAIPASIKIESDLIDKKARVFGDPTRVHQVLMNLCTNAYHAMEGRESGKLIIRTEKIRHQCKNSEEHKDKNNIFCLKISIIDTGCGMKQEVIDRIFEPFYSTKEEGKGTGLGLHLVHSIIKEMSGDIEVESKLGEGSTFSIILPYYDVGTTTKDIEKLRYEKGSETVMIVDDQTAVINLENRILRKLGYNVDLETDSVIALKHFTENPTKFDLLITDYTMPNMSGLTLAQKVREIREDIPILVISGSSEITNKEGFSSLSNCEIVMKPIDINHLSIKIRKLLKGENKDIVS